jgi:CDP-glycerol glycerophosphotransferase (TagB/SpsB family)
LNQPHNKKYRYLFYVEQDYSFDILRPLAVEAKRRGCEVGWLLLADASTNLLQPDEQRLVTAGDAVRFAPNAVFVPGDRVPAFIPGLKVQVFHGLNEDKRGNRYPERGLFDLFCTEGPSRTVMLAPLAKQRGYFQVRETGWPKLDTLLNYQGRDQTYDRPQIFYASTFTPSLSGAEALFPEISALSQSDQWQWLVTLHPKMAPETVAKYKGLESKNLGFFGTSNLIELMYRADIMVSDNSSVLQEFLLLKKPVITFRNRDPQPCMINITEANELGPAIGKALAPDQALTDALDDYGPAITPYLDGASAPRVLDAVEGMLEEGWQDNKPTNLWRNLKMRKQLNYYGF